MKQMLDTVWQRRGVSWIWDNDAFASVATAAEVFSLRQLIRASKDWPDDLPSNDGKTLVVAGLDACLDLLSPTDAADWLNSEIKSAVLSFRDFYTDGAALIFWLPTSQRRLTIAPATDAVQWRCAAPHADEQIEFGRLLWGAAWDYPKEIILAQGGKPAGLFHLRIT